MLFHPSGPVEFAVTAIFRGDQNAIAVLLLRRMPKGEEIHLLESCRRMQRVRGGNH